MLTFTGTLNAVAVKAGFTLAIKSARSVATSCEGMTRSVVVTFVHICTNTQFISNHLFTISIYIIIFTWQLDIYKNQGLSYCCDSRSYCMQEYDQLKQLPRDTLSILTLFTVIAAS